MVMPLASKMQSRALSLDGCVADSVFDSAADCVAAGGVQGLFGGFAIDIVAVLKRSDDHPFYHSPRMAQFPSYGVGRSNLMNAPEVAQRLLDQGIAAQVVEFGAMTLGQQIQVATRARALVGIRGAEFATVMWMRPNTHAIMLATPTRENHATRTLSRIRGVRFASIAVSSAEIWLDSADQQTIAQILGKELG